MPDRVRRPFDPHLQAQSMKAAKNAEFLHCLHGYVEKLPYGITHCKECGANRGVDDVWRTSKTP